MKYNENGPPCNRLLTLTTAVGASRVEEGIPENQGADFPRSADSAESLVVFAQLVPLQGGEPITIDKDVTVVGRQAEHCDIVLDRKSVSKIHCIIARTDGLLFVRDLDSTNGTKVNGQRIIRGALLPGDQLAFAGEKFRVHLGPSPAAPAEPTTDRTEPLNAFSAQPAEQFSEESSLSSRVEPMDEPGEADDLVE